MKKTERNYNAPEITIAINNGKLQFTTVHSDFATMVDHFANSKNKEIAITKECAKMIETRENLIAENIAEIERIKHNASISAYVREDDMNTQIAEIEQKISTLKKEIADIDSNKTTMLKNLRKHKFELDETDDNLWCAYRDYMDGKLIKREYIIAIAAWFNAHNVPAHVETINEIIKFIGRKAATNNELYKSNGTQFTSVYQPKAYADMFYRALADLCVKAGTIRKFDFNKSYYQTANAPKQTTTQNNG